MDLHPALVLSTTEEACTVVAGGRRAVVPYASFFPGDRRERVLPAHLVAVETAPGGSAEVVWRWFDAVVVGGTDGRVELWEPGHGLVSAEPRDAATVYRPGSRAYASAGLPGADWWVAGPAVDRAEAAAVDLLEVERFLAAVRSA